MNYEIVAVNNLTFDEAVALMDILQQRAAQAGITTQEYFRRWCVGDMPSAPVFDRLVAPDRGGERWPL